MLSRRGFLKGALAGAALAALPLGQSGWAFASPGGGAQRRLIVIFLRGAVDGLSVVVPYGEAAYAHLRPRIAIPRPGLADGALDLDGRFGLHPALAPLLPQWRAGKLAFVHACGSPDPTRSHFDAQDYMESGTPGAKRTQDGWLNRLVASLPGPHSPNQAVSVGETIPRILSGQATVANLALGGELPTDQPRVGAAFDKMYAGTDALSAAWRDGRASRASLLEDLQAEDQEMKAANAGAPLPNGFVHDAAQVAALIRHDARIRVAFLALGGWDTHVNQGAARGQLAGRLKALGEGLAVLAEQLGPAFADTTILVMSEFGRTVAENGNGGTDHGHGNVLWALGGNVGGGKVYGRWPGLADAAKYQGRDLAVTTDFRDVVATVLGGHLGVPQGDLARILPDRPGAADLRGLIRG
ncbi:MAG: hypothetical protein JWM80_5678 [Cyanobacteria bacterium RYN_339]|nr:hypothetical protein [Cyanobacteria bacterium RYN_339]